jgi:uncharacterized protein (DUF2141 family)
MLIQILAFALLLPAGPAQAQQTAQNMIQVEAGGLRSDKGHVMCALYSSAEGFPKSGDRALAHAESSISNGHGTCDFMGIQPGRYAIAIFHDENSNGKLDTNLLGIPREGVGASNNAKGRFGPPKFEDAAFQFAGGRLDLKITVSYM